MSDSGATFRSLKHRNAQLFFFGLMISNVGSWMQLTATSVLLYELTGDATTLGVNAAAQFLPMLLLGIWAGAIADRVNRRRLTMITQAGMALQAFLLAGMVLIGNVNAPAVYLLSLFLGVVSAIDNPARRGLVIELVEKDDISNAMSLNTTVMTGSRIFGPALAALLIGPLGPGWLFFGNGVSFVALIGSIAAIDERKLYRTPPAPPGGTPVRDAFRYVRGHSELFPVFVTFSVVATFAFNYNVSLPKLADQRWDSPDAYGWLLAAVSFGSLLGALVGAKQHTLTYKWFTLAGVMLAVGNISMAWAPNLPLAFIAALPLGAGGAAFVAASNSISQYDAPPDMRSRMLALVAVAFLGSTPIGGPITGWVADHVSVEWSLGYGGVITFACMAWLTFRTDVVK